MIPLNNNLGMIGQKIMPIPALAVNTAEPKEERLEQIVKEEAPYPSEYYAPQDNRKKITSIIKEYLANVRKYFNLEYLKATASPLPPMDIYNAHDIEGRNRIISLISQINKETPESFIPYISNFISDAYKINMRSEITNIYDKYGMNGLRFTWAYLIAGNHGTKERERALQLKYLFETVVEKQGFKLERQKKDTEASISIRTYFPKQNLKGELPYKQIA